MGRRRVLGSLVTSVVLVLAGVLPAAEAKKEGRRGELSLLTYNVAGLPEPLSGSEPATNSQLISPLLDAYDLVLLQENWQDPLHDLRAAGLVGDEVPSIMYHHEVVGAASHPYRSVPAPHPYGTDLRRLPTEPPLLSDGLNRLSRLPFGPLTRVMWERCHGGLLFTALEEVLDESGAFDALAKLGLADVRAAIDGGSTDCSAQKGFSVARTRLADGATVDVYNLHADAGGGAESVAARAANFEQLAGFLRAHSSGRAVILAGDTNLATGTSGRTADGEVWTRFLAATGLMDVCGVLDCGPDDGAIDKVAYRSGGVVELEAASHLFERQRFTRADGTALADHDPLAVRFRWGVSRP